MGITDKITVNSSCVGCGTCVKICPMNNIELAHGEPNFGKNCISCGGCLQNCPLQVIHHKEEKSEARYRNPHVRVEELFCSVKEDKSR